MEEAETFWSAQAIARYFDRPGQQTRKRLERFGPTNPQHLQVIENPAKDELRHWSFHRRGQEGVDDERDCERIAIMSGR